MNNMSNEFIKEALLAVERRELALLSAIPTVEHERSSGYEARIKWISGAKKRVATHRRKIVAAIVVAAVLMLSITACAFKEPITKFFVEVFENATSFSTGGKGATRIEEVYSPHYLPYGYVETSRRISYINVRFSWSNGAEEISFMQMPSASGEIDLSSSADEPCMTATINGETAYYIHKKNKYSLLWKDNRYFFVLDFPDTVSREDVEKIISSIFSIGPLSEVK